MSKKARYLLGILATILLGSWLYTVFCCNCCTVENAPSDKEVSTTENMTTEEIIVKNNGFHFSSPEVSYNCNANFNFLMANFTLLKPVSDSVNLGISKLKEVLEKKNSHVKIIGFYDNEESNNSIFPNLGLARANAVKNYLVEKGFSEKNIEISEQLQDKLVAKGDTVTGPIDFQLFEVKESPTNEKDWQTVKKNLNADPLTLYFNTGQSTILLTQEQKKHIAEIINYINHVEGAKISITGHTDNDPGVRNTNQYYSEERAKFAKKYFVANGIPEGKMLVSGKGESKPIADNATEEGRAKNRRTEITIQ